MANNRLTGLLVKAAVTLIAVSLLCFLGYKLFYGQRLSGEDNSKWQVDKVSQDGKYDIIVFGGDPEGVAAAVAASRLGARVLLLSYEDGLGGLMTYGMLNSIDMNYNSRKVLVTAGIFKEFYKKVGGDSFDVGHAKQVLTDMIAGEKNITYIPSVEFVSPLMDGKIIVGVKILKDGVQKDFAAHRIIDATQDGDITAAAGAPFKFGHEDIGLKDRIMCATLVFRVWGVDWNQLKEDIRNREKSGIKGEGINNRSAWGYGEIRKEYKPRSKNMKMRGLNIGKQDDGSVLINALQIFIADVLDRKAKERAINEASLEAQNVVSYLKQSIPAFSNATFGGVAPQLYIRESRHITGEYVLKVSDVLNNVDFWDKVSVGSYSIDIQATNMADPGAVLGNPDQYSIPLRCLIPLKLENVFIVGRSASYSSHAAGSARVIPVGMVTGQAAGVAAVYSIANNLSPRQLCDNKTAVSDIQIKLKKQGAYLPNFNIQNPNWGHWAYQDAQKLLALGLIKGGYDNDLKFEEPIETELLKEMLEEGTRRFSPNKYDNRFAESLRMFGEGKYVNSSTAAQMTLYVYERKKYDADSAWDEAKNRGLLSPEFSLRAREKKEILRQEAYSQVVYIMEKMAGREIEF